jgi:hypothetical protein
MTMHRKHLLTLAIAGLMSASIGALGAASADETVVVPEASTEAPAAIAPATPETASEVAPSSGSGTAEEPAFSVMPSEGPGGGCHGRGVEEPAV